MTLRLKKHTATLWSFTHDGILSSIQRLEGSCYLKENMNSEDNRVLFYQGWNEKNLYKTEYKKMRAALVEYLAPKSEFTNEDYGRMADEERQKRMQAEAEIERLTADLARMVKQHEADKQTINEMALKYMEQENVKDQALLDAYALVHKKEAKRLSKRHRIDFKQAPSNKFPRTVTF